MRSLVLGGNGFIGSHLIDKLLEEGHFVRVFDRYEEHYRKPLKGVDYCCGDFGNRGLIANALENIDIVFHLITTTVPKTSNEDPIFDITSNVIETLFLLEQCVKNRVKKVIFISSGGTIYGNVEKSPIVENSPTDPLCSYGISKLAIEKYLALFHHLYGLDYVILRPSNPYGTRQNPFGIQGAISVFLGKIARGESIEIWGNGEVVRDYIYIDDLIEGIYLTATLSSKYNIYNLGSGTGHSLNDIIKTIQEITALDIKVNYKEGRIFDIPSIYLDISRAMSELSWKPVIPLNEGIEKTWQFMKTIIKPVVLR